jgi:hypothetical protein
LFNCGRKAISVAVSVLDDRLFLYHVRPTIPINDDLVTRLALADNFLLVGLSVSGALLFATFVGAEKTPHLAGLH